MEQEFNSETDSDYTSYWRDWVSADNDFRFPIPASCNFWVCIQMSALSISCNASFPPSPL